MDLAREELRAMRKERRGEGGSYPRVLVSALITPPGNSAKLLAATRDGSFERIVSALLLEELGSVLRRQKFPRHVDLDVVDRYMALLQRDATRAVDSVGAPPIR